jgi:hypothetical protein
MKSVAKITVFLMAVTALEASRLGSPSEVSGHSLSGVVWTCCVVDVIVIVIVIVLVAALFQPSSKQIADCRLPI